MKRLIVLALGLLFAVPAFSEAQCANGQPGAKASARKPAQAQQGCQECENPSTALVVPDKLEGSALMNVTSIRQGRWRLGPVRNRILTNRRGPAPPRYGRTKTLMMQTTIYPGKKTPPPMTTVPRTSAPQPRGVNINIQSSRMSPSRGNAGQNCKT